MIKSSSSRKKPFPAKAALSQKAETIDAVAEIRKKPLPRHVAVIMDGNGRWAKERGLPRVAGHRQGVKSVKAVVEACGELGIEVLTLYAFSQENWKRPTWEVSALMRLLMNTIHSEIKSLNANNVRVRTIGLIDQLPAATLRQVNHAMEVTKNNTGLVLCLALSYGGRAEIIGAVRKAIERKMTPANITEDNFAQLLDTGGLPDPDLVIRTSGEHRISNFLLWQIAYAEIHVTPVYWPDFRKQNLIEAIRDYQRRERRFGMVSEQIIKKQKS